MFVNGVGARHLRGERCDRVDLGARPLVADQSGRRADLEADVDQHAFPAGVRGVGGLEPWWLCLGWCSCSRACHGDNVANRRNLAMFLAMSAAHPARSASDNRLVTGGVARRRLGTAAGVGVAVMAAGGTAGGGRRPRTRPCDVCRRLPGGTAPARSRWRLGAVGVGVGGGVDVDQVAQPEPSGGAIGRRCRQDVRSTALRRRRRCRPPASAEGRNPDHVWLRS
jgi:hypothetical protein